MKIARSAVRASIACLLAATTLSAAAGTPNEIRADLQAAARRDDSRFAGFSADRGRAFFGSRHGGDWSCASCHTEDPLAVGRHVATGKRIKPLAPAANPKRFSDAAKVQKWFDRNCSDVLRRVCTAQEKGDVLEYLLSVAR